MVEVGRIYIKNTGREAGRHCVVLKKISNSFAIVSGPRLLTGIKRRRCNASHLTPTLHKLDIKEDATDEEVIAAMEKENLITKLKLKRPSAAKIKTEAKAEAEKAAKKEQERQEKAAAETKKKEKKESKKAENKK